MIIRWILVSLCWISLTVQAAPAQQALDNFLLGLNTLSAGFVQTVDGLSANYQEVTRGEFVLQRPDRLRWDYQVPEQRLILADGKNVWLVENDLEQITQYGQNMVLRNTPISVLLAGEPLEQNFVVTEQGERAGMDWLGLQPHDQESEVTQIQLGFANNQLSQLELTDQFGQLTQVRFFDMERNPALPDNTFVFEPPPGWDLFTH